MHQQDSIDVAHTPVMASQTSAAQFFNTAAPVINRVGGRGGVLLASVVITSLKIFIFFKSPSDELASDYHCLQISFSCASMYHNNGDSSFTKTSSPTLWTLSHASLHSRPDITCLSPLQA